MKHLLAKWRREDYSEARGFRLAGHMTEVLWGLRLLFEQPWDGAPSFAHALHERMALPISFESFKTRCVLATAFHDLGKCGSEFQRMLYRLEDHYQKHGVKPDGFPYRQVIRHELLSGLVMYHDPRVRSYIESQVGMGGLFAVIGGAAGHHLKATGARGIRDPGRRAWPGVTMDLPGWAKSVSKLLVGFGLPPLPDLNGSSVVEVMLSTEDSARKAWTSLNKAATKFGFSTLRKEDAAVKWITILADVFGSVDNNQGPSNTLDVRRRVADELARVGQSWDEQDDVLFKRVRKKIGADTALNEVQEAAAAVSDNLILTAATGVGKTVAAMAWAARTPRKLIFAAHTTDAASLLHADYGIRGDELRHSRARITLRLRPTPEDSKIDQEEAEQEAAAAMTLFRGGMAPVTFCTADQVLGLPAFYRNSVMWLPVILSSQIVFDEVHSYDNRMAGWHRRFLEYFPKIRVANLSATLSAVGVERLMKLTNGTWDPSAYRQLGSVNAPRYRIVVLPKQPEAWPEGRYGLWIVNTVERCQNLAHQHDAVAYHSRYRYIDRQQARDKLVNTFRGGAESGRVVATQVAEMSLDIDANVLVSEIAPPDALIQRLGRLNRYLKHGVSTAFFYMPDVTSGQPYADEGWEAIYAEWVAWLKNLEGRDLSQLDLENAFQEYERKFSIRQDAAQTLKLVETERKSIREAGVTVSAVLQDDVNGDLPVELVELPVILCRDRINELLQTGKVWKYRLILDQTDGTYESALGWLRNP